VLESRPLTYLSVLESRPLTYLSVLESRPLTYLSVLESRPLTYLVTSSLFLSFLLLSLLSVLFSLGRCVLRYMFFSLLHVLSPSLWVCGVGHVTTRSIIDCARTTSVFFFSRLLFLFLFVLLDANQGFWIKRSRRFRQETVSQPVSLWQCHLSWSRKTHFKTLAK
jgi:hypothetical protein